MYKVINTKWMKCRKEMKFKIWNNEKWTANSIGAKGATKISESLMTNTTLTKLDLSDDDWIIKNGKEWWIKTKHIKMIINR